MRPITSPKPFQLTSVARHEIYEDSRQKTLAMQREAEEAVRA